MPTSFVRGARELTRAASPTLQNYQRQVAASGVITQDQIHNLFLNLNSLADFQRRFLIGVEANASLPPEDQHFGHLFLTMVRVNILKGQLDITLTPDFLQEDNFSVYEPYCANLTAAQELAISENTALNVSSCVSSPVLLLPPHTRSIPSTATKRRPRPCLGALAAPHQARSTDLQVPSPPQRTALPFPPDLPPAISTDASIVRLVHLVQTLIKNTPATAPGYQELVEGHASIERVTDKVNETTRREDNRLSVVDLQRRVEDWKGHDITSFGDLLLREIFFVIKSDSEREYSVYLFERIILCCKEMGISGKKSNKSNSILKRPASRRVANLQLKGRIFVNNVTIAHNVSRNGTSQFAGVFNRGRSSDR